MREVTERDLRAPEFRDADPAELEFREGDGKIVRKDRWERGIRSIWNMVGSPRKQFEIDDVVSAVAKLAIDWNTPEHHEDILECQRIDVLLDCGSVIKGLELCADGGYRWHRFGLVFRMSDFGEKIVGWVKAAEPAPEQVAADTQEGEWARSQTIANLPAVHEALDGFQSDPTGDSGVMVVREVLRALGHEVEA